MSQFSGRQARVGTKKYHGNKGIMSARRDEKRVEAEARNAKSSAAMRLCGHVHGSRFADMCREQ